MISWLATTACLRFGQIHHPKGIYIPNSLSKDDGETVPHPRRRIKDTFADGDIVLVSLKDRSKKQTSDEREWYEKAFGPKQNIMNIRIIFKPQILDHIKKGKSEIWAEIKYKMFFEMEGEFSKADYPEKRRVKIDGYEDDNGIWEFEQEFEYPYGTFEIEVKWDAKGKKEEELDLKELPDSEKEFLIILKEPEPVSMEQLRQDHANEEEENKKREQEARLAQKRLEEEKARLRYEQQ